MVVVLVLYVYKYHRHIMTGIIPYPPLRSQRGVFLPIVNNELECDSGTSIYIRIPDIKHRNRIFLYYIILF